jgi:hypothetical protein
MRSPERMKMTWSLWAGFAGLGMVWWLAVRMLWVEWEVDPQYGYGFLVPILCGVLFLQRWKDRPQPTTHGASWLMLGLGGSALLYLLAVPPFFEANPEWRPLGAQVELQPPRYRWLGSIYMGAVRGYVTSLFPSFFS